MHLISLILSILTIFVHISSCRSFAGGIDGKYGRIYIKRAETDPMAPKVPRFDEFLGGPEMFEDFGGMGRLSNMQRLG